jgi:hypothetical protein
VGFPVLSSQRQPVFWRKRDAVPLLAAGTIVITGPKVLDFYAGFCAHRATWLKVDGKDITDLKLMLNGDSNEEKEVGPPKS